MRAVGDRQRQDFPEYFAAQRAAASGFGRSQFYGIGPPQYIGQEAIQTDIDNLKAALTGVQTVEVFILPEGKTLIPGVVGHDSDTIEHPELVAEYICNYASIVGRENVIAGTDCGFGTGQLHPAIAQLKFQILVEGARLASKRLWSR